MNDRVNANRPDARGRTRYPDRGSPRLPHLLSMTWRDGLFLHWPVDPERVRPHVPDPLELDTRDGTAWIGVLPFVLARTGLRGTPTAARLTFPELNVRTYVRYRGDPGLFFFSIDVGNAVVAETVGRLTRLPVHRAAMHVGGDDERVAFSSARPPAAGDDPDVPARFSATYRPDGDVRYPDRDSLLYWLLERRRFFAPESTGVLLAEIGHAPWPVQSAAVTVHENTLFAANGLPEPTGERIAHYCGELPMTGSILRRV